MTLPKDRKLKRNQDMEIHTAVEDFDIKYIHPDKMEEWAEHLVQNLKNGIERKLEQIEAVTLKTYSKNVKTS